MKLIIIALLSAILLASTSFAEGLEITRVDARADYDYSTTYKLEQEEKITRINFASVPLKNNSKISLDVFPGANLTFTVTIENTFRDTTQILRDVFAKITIEGRHGQKLKELSGDFELEAGSEAKADVKISIPFDVDSGPHNVFIDVEGTGKNHTLHKIELSSNLDVSKLSHDLRITMVSLEPNTIDCKRKLQLSAETANAGSNAEDEVALEFRSPSLGINSYDRNISLASSSDDGNVQIMHAKALNIEVPSFFKPGTYPIFVNLYWQNFILFDQKTVYLTVKDCKPNAPTKPGQEIKNQTSVPVIQPAKETSKIPAEGLITRTEEVSVLDSPVLFSLLLGGIFLIVVLAALIVFGLLKKSKI